MKKDTERLIEAIKQAGYVTDGVTITETANRRLFIKINDRNYTFGNYGIETETNQIPWDHVAMLGAVEMERKKIIREAVQALTDGGNK